MLLLPHPPSSVQTQDQLFNAAPGTIHRILLVAIQEWSAFGGMTMRGNVKEHVGHTETEGGFWQKVGEYWQKGTGQNLTGKDTGVPWSATFISFVMRQAGVNDHDFQRATAHSKYIYMAMQNRLFHKFGAVFVAQRLTEYSPKEGDLVCTGRDGSGMSFDKAMKQDSYKSHTDIVVYTRPGEIGVIGGNVADSVTLKKLTIDGGGHLNDTSHPWFAVMENLLPL